MRTIIITGIILAAAPALRAQDSTRKREVTVTASFQPELPEISKINFSATPPAADTTRPQLQYSVPNQNLAFAYQPGTLKPLAFATDSILRWNNANYVKAGYGTLRTPYLEAGLSAGDRDASVSLLGHYWRSQGRLRFQETSQAQLDAYGQLRLDGNHRLSGRIGFSEDQYFRYGFQPQQLDFAKDSLALRYRNFRAQVTLRNTQPTAYGISYAPELRFDAFGNGRGSNESTVYLNLPLRKTLEGRFEVLVSAEGAITRYSPLSGIAQSNTWFQLSPSLQVKTSTLYVQAGLRPSWDNGRFRLMPNLLAEVGTEDKRLSLVAGWTGHLRANNLQYLSSYNPWMNAPLAINNSRIEEIYGGVKGSITDHVSFLLRGGLNLLYHTPLFLNDGADRKSFAVRFEPDMRAINLHGELGYTKGETFSLRTSLDLNRYASLDLNEEAWGLPVLESKTSLRLQVLRDLYVKSDLYAFEGVAYRDADGANRTLGGFDAAAGLEFNVYRNIKVWGQFNNLFNRNYQRWHQYPTYGFQFLGGLVFSFPQNRR